MKPVYRGLAVAVLQCLIVLSVAGKYALDRERLPRVWAKAAPFDPNLFVRGRYVSLRLQVDAPANAGQWVSARLSVVESRLVATPDPAGSVQIAPERRAVDARRTGRVLHSRTCSRPFAPGAG
jgi:hypothetical protein